MSNDKPIEQKILEELEKSGYPLEIDVTDILRINKWHTYNQRPYLDIDENKFREIDIDAYKNKIIFEPRSKYKFITVRLIIECKKSINPWVFYLRNVESLPPSAVPSIDKCFKELSKPKLETSIMADLNKYIHYNNADKISVIHIEPFKGKEQIFDAINKVIKCLYFERKQFEVKLESLKWPILTILYPVIVFDGPLFVLYNKQTVEPIQHLNHYQSYKSLNIDEIFLIDIVHVSYFDKFIKIIDYELERIVEEFAQIKLGTEEQ